MTELLEAPSLSSGFFIAGILSGALALFTARLRHAATRWLLATLAPALLSYGLYWAPVQAGADPSEYSAWAMICIVPWSAIGILTSIAVMIGVRQHMKNNQSNQSNSGCYKP